MVQPFRSWIVLILLLTCCRPPPNEPFVLAPVESQDADVPLEVVPAPRPRVPAAIPTTESEYTLPPRAIQELLRTPPPPDAALHPQAGWLLLAYRESLVPLSRLARPKVTFAGLRIDQGTYVSPAETRITRLKFVSLKKTLDSGEPVHFELHPPEGTLLQNPLLSPDGTYLAALVLTESTAELGVYSLERHTWSLKGGPIQTAFGPGCHFTNNNRLFCAYVPTRESPAPERIYGPSIQEHFGGPVRINLREDFLKDASDEQTFEYFFSSEIREVDLTEDEIPTKEAITPKGETPPKEVTQPKGPDDEQPKTEGPARKSTALGPAGVIPAFTPSPDGEWLHVTTLKRPYSRITAWEYFPHGETIWNVAQKKPALVLRLEKGSELKFLGPTLGRRETRWHPFEPATITWIERSVHKKLIRERWLARAMPARKNAQPRTLKTALQIVDRGFTSKGTPWVVASGFEWGPLQNGTPEVSHGIQSSPERKALTTALRADCGSGPILEENGTIYVSAERGNDGVPTLEAVDLQTGEQTVIWKSPADHYEKILCVIDRNTWISVRETEKTAPRYFVHQRGETVRSITAEYRPYPTLDKTTRRLVKYMRDDGLEMSANLYLPAGYKAGRPVPTVVWIYPTEFTEEDYAKYPATATEHRFATIAGPSRLSLVLAGYAVLDNPTMPIVGENGRENNNYLDHLRLSAEAAVRFLVKERIAVPGKIAVAGRSYGAFSAANLLAHTDLFATGIAISGAYNRTLTPFGFQNERRSFWRESDLYARMSPFFVASSINEPLLLIHGQEDDNPGTPLMQSERMFHAVVGIGGQARLVVLPLEGHQMRGEQTVLHVAAEMVSWLDRHLRPKERSPSAGGRPAPASRKSN